MQTDKYEKDGITRYSTKIIANNMTMLGQVGSSSNNSNNSGADDFEDDDIPF